MTEHPIFFPRLSAFRIGYNRPSAIQPNRRERVEELPEKPKPHAKVQGRRVRQANKPGVV